MQTMGARLNSALELLLRDERLYLLGEDITDPYGGAFKVTKGLSSRYPGRVLTTPISEAGMAAVANGLAIAGARAIVEIMFSDFVGLCFDQILNVSAKSVSMYGHEVAMPVVFRCPTGGNRGYGPTHSQSLQKHFIGIPDLSLWEMSPFHEDGLVLETILESGRPALYFEDKICYARPALLQGDLDRFFTWSFHDGPLGWAHVRPPDRAGTVLVIVAGGSVSLAIEAGHDLAVRHEVDIEILVPARLYPLDMAAVLELVADADGVVVVDEGPPGGSWADEVAVGLLTLPGAESLITRLRKVNAHARPIPAARHLEQQVLPSSADISAAVLEVLSR
jgi:pyruvate dehydrogenase E1 component beta subunit